MLIDKIINLKAKCCIEDEIGEEFNLSVRELSCIFCLKDGEMIHSKDLSMKINLSPSRGSRIINGLIQKGYLLETHNPDDKRYTNLSISEKGLDIYKEANKKKYECEKRLLGNLNNNQKRLVEEGLNILLGVM